MIISLLYHRVGNGKYATPKERLRDHFDYIADHYPTLFLGDPIPSKTALSLTFDDATYDFYSDIFPMLCHFKIKATLFVPTQYILSTSQSQGRLPSENPFLDPHQFCTFEELKVMQQSGFVEIGSHSHSHQDLTTLSHEALWKELRLSKMILEEALEIKVNSIAFPYGKFNRKVLAVAKEHYRYAMRIGNAINFGWRPLLYRIVADNLSTKEFPFPLPIGTKLNHFIHRARFR